MKYLFLLLISFSVYCEVGIPVLEEELVEAEIFQEENEQSTIDFHVNCLNSNNEYIHGATLNKFEDAEHYLNVDDRDCYITEEQ